MVKEKKCGHLPIIHDLETDIEKYDAELEKALTKIDALENGSKFGELASVQKQCRQAEEELHRLRKRANYNENGTIMKLYDDIKAKENKVAEMTKAVKLLNRLSKYAGKRLVDEASE